ncbi:tissue factor-like [Mastacembelus armatus]|uniref:Tissue factor n=1 Tax=Mastacembelus armatus TaxID=205130 RepID=A0A3Q3LWU4_9TELE|nr:tissue factor-like [Mastacembelus armatus]
MASLKNVLYLGVCLSAWIITTTNEKFVPKAENVQWVSLDFKTILTWTTKASNYSYTVLYSWNDSDWSECADCIQISEPECDLSQSLVAFDRTYTADIRTEPAMMNNGYNHEEFPHTHSPLFNPYRDSNISAVKFTVEVIDDSRVLINITDPLTSIYQHGKQLRIRDILKNDLKYKISYYKSGSTGKRDIISDSSLREVSELDAEESYCFMVAAYIPSRPKTTQLGAWSKQLCTQRQGSVLQELSLGAWVGAVSILLTVLIIIITVTALCCKCCSQRNKTVHTSQSSAPV